MLKVVRFLIVFLSAGFFVSSASAAPATFVYQGQILDEFAIPVEAASVSFKIQIFSPMPSKCLLYEESFSPVNMTDSNGLFALPIGTGTVSPSSQYSTLLDVFDNSLGSVSPTICEGVASYDANDGDLRYIRVTFNKGAGDFVVPDRPMYSAPFALNAARVGGLTENNILQVNVAAPAVLSQSNLEWVFESTRFPELQNLINGSSSQYMSSTPSSAPNFNGQVVDNIASPADGDDATNKNYVDARLGGQLVNSVVNSPGAAQDGYALVWDNSTNRYTLVEGSSALGDHLGNHTATTNLIMGANYISNDGTASQGLSFDGSNNANFSQDLTVSQGFSVTNGITSAGPIQLNSQQELRLFDSDSSNYVAHRAAGTTTSNYTVQWPAAGPGSANLILRSDASGVLSWTTDTITSVFSRTGDVVAQSGDYTASQVTNVAAGGIAATDVQAAVNELDSEKYDKTGGAISGNVTLENEAELRLSENALNGTNYIALKAPALLGGNFSYELPANYGSSGNLLSSDGAGGLTWVDMDHDALTNFVANEHIDHTSVSINTNSGSALSGGGNISASRNLQVQVDNSSIEISSNALRLRALGVQNSHLANDSVNSAKIDNGSIVDADVSASAALSRSKLATGNNNRVLINNGSGQMAEAAAITPNRALASDANGLPVAGSATRSELGHLSGVTSNLQTQLNGKQNSLGYTPVDVSGDTMTGALAVVAGSAAAPGLQVSGDSNTGIFSSGSDTLSISTAGSEAVFVNASGNVGVGSGSPQARLDVNGGVRVGGDADGCVSAKEGTVRFNGVTKQLQVCDGSSWSTIGGSFVTVSPPGSITTMMTASCPTGFLAADGSAVDRSTYSDLFAAIGVMYGNGNGSTTFNVPDMRGYFVRGVDGGAGNDPDAASRTDRGDGTTGDAVGTKQGDEIKAHNHGNGTLGGTTSTDGAHTHGNGTLGGTTNSAGAHTHAKGTLGGTTSTAGAHTHTYYDYYRNGANVDGGDGGTGISGLANGARTTASAGAHSHTLNITGSTASAGAHSHTLNITGSIASAGAHSHTLNITGSIASHGGSESRPKNINALYCIKY